MFIVTYYVTIFYWKSLGFFLWSLDCKHSSALMKFDTMCIHHPLKFQSSCPTLYCLVIIFLNGKRLDWHKTTISDNAFLSRRKIVFKLSGNVRLLDVPILMLGRLKLSSKRLFSAFNFILLFCQKAYRPDSSGPWKEDKQYNLCFETYGDRELGEAIFWHLKHLWLDV